MKTEIIFRNPKTKQTKAEAYAATLGISTRQIWTKKHGIEHAAIAGRPAMIGVGDEVYLNVERPVKLAKLLALLETAGLRRLRDATTWGGHKYLFGQYNEAGELLGNIVVTKYRGVGLGMSVHNHFARGDAI